MYRTTMRAVLGLLFLIGLSLAQDEFYHTNIKITDGNGMGREFDGIGGVSGGGATSKLLVNYPQKQRDEVLDYLFKPNYGASLQILKVEIGGDAQSTDGAEASHMHEPDDENYHRGYEWWLMKEAKKRNPGIKLYGLPWVFPGWLDSESDTSPTKPDRNYTRLADYLIKWIKGAKAHHNLDIDYMGIWNERTIEIGFVKFFRKTLNEVGLSHVQLISHDKKSWGIADDLTKDHDYLNAIYAIGQHYPEVYSPESAIALGKRIWASEDYSSRSNVFGGGCWARVLNEGPVLGHYSAFIAWNLIASYFDGMPYTRTGLMVANKPWTGYYSVDSPIWVTAHHTFFYQPGWKYLPHGSGLGNFNGNGSYITLVSPDETDMTIVISTMDPVNMKCAYKMPKYTISANQKATFQLDGKFKNIEKLNAWYTYLNVSDEKKSTLFKQIKPVQVINGEFTLNLEKNVLITLTTVEKEKPNYPTDIPREAHFPSPFYEDFENMPIGEEPYNFSPQSGAYEVTMSDDPKHKKVITQVVIRPPVDTCWWKHPRPPLVTGDFYWKDVHVEVDAFVDRNDKHKTNGVFLASQVEQGGCDINVKRGIYLYVNFDKQNVELCYNHSCVAESKITDIPYTRDLYNKWFTVSLDVQGNDVIAKIDDKVLFEVTVIHHFLFKGADPKYGIRYVDHGFVAFGPNTFGRASFDNFHIKRANIK